MQRKIFFILLLFYVSSFLYAQQSPVQSNLTNLEDYVINLENESLMQKMLIESLEEQLSNANQSVESLNLQLEEAYQLQEMQSNSLKKLEFKCKVLRISLEVGIPVSIIATGILCYCLNN